MGGQNVERTSNRVFLSLERGNSGLRYDVDEHAGSQNGKLCVIPLGGGSQCSQTHQDAEQNGGCRELMGGGGGEVGSYCLMGTEVRLGKMDSPVDGGDGHTTM